MSSDMILREEVYNARAASVWNALTDKEKMKQWYFDIPDFELKEGAVFNFYEPGGKNQFHHQCKIKEIVPSKKFQHTWTYPDHSKGATVLTWELFEEGENRTRVKLSHSGIDSFADGGEALASGNFQAGWDEIMGSSLKKFLEHPEPDEG